MNQKNLKFPTKFRPHFESIWRFIIFYGGRGSGKSFSIARALILRAYQSPARVLCCREIQKSIIKELKYLKAELSRPRVDYDNNGRVKVESKKDMKKRGIPSPNMVDALVMCYAPTKPKSLLDL